MPRTIRFHTDEQVARAVALGLRRLGVDVTTTPEAGLRRAPDDQQIAYGNREGRVIFTQDSDFLIAAAAGVPHAGVAYCQPDSRSIGQIIAGLELIWELLEPDEIRGRVEYV